MPSEQTVHRAIACLALLALVAGLLLLALAQGTDALIGAIVLLGVAGIVFVALIFMLVGESEEHDRARHPNG